MHILPEWKTSMIVNWVKEYFVKFLRNVLHYVALNRRYIRQFRIDPYTKQSLKLESKNYQTDLISFINLQVVKILERCATFVIVDWLKNFHHPLYCRRSVP
jgi:hypothetical protein